MIQCTFASFRISFHYISDGIHCVYMAWIGVCSEILFLAWHCGSCLKRPAQMAVFTDIKKWKHCRCLWNNKVQFSCNWVNYIYPISKGLWYMIDDFRPKPSTTCQLLCKWWDHHNLRGIGWVVLKFGEYFGNDSNRSWLTFQGHGSKVKRTISETVMALVILKYFVPDHILKFNSCILVWNFYVHWIILQF